MPVDAAGDPVEAVTDLSIILSSGWRFKNNVTVIYEQLVNPPIGPDNKAALIFIFEDITYQHQGAKTNGPMMGLAGTFSVTGIGQVLSFF